ncbi:DUF4276 family protein [Adhaeribacter pallidiroseus]|uniref:DUF4276 family protein n=1 Tax=Adhaeribacter pallidiroseus TaxID=2072847 RepID=A0A369Q6S6_9BACT|nr:DUF4276 family protein [Adhaeribacter pallidiroseus]RDC58760.1 hypothetical protein AHMF7616_05194 [Adhaeribacter pallidiroseus]RDC58836.1 hypothetical protein AHMF7616_05270 [Adhaeribacter pallidiroseus]
MRGLYILAEGPTEEEFINEVLSHYFYDKGIYDVRAILMSTSPGFKGGDVTYQRYKLNAENLLKREQDIIVTSLIDYFRLRTDFPEYAQAQTIIDKYKRVDFLENAVANDINSHRFLPYIQLHEFEGLLFSHTAGFDYLPDLSDANKQQLYSAVQEHDNPEMLNDGAETAPSKRLEKLIPGYKKTLHGPVIATEISLSIIMQRCIRFNNWIQALTQRMQQN